MSHMHYKTQFVPFVRDREHEHGMIASAGSEQSQSCPMLSPNVAKRGIPKDLTLERAFHDTLPESSPSLRHLEGLPKAGIVYGYLVSLAGSLSWTFWSPFEPTCTSWIHNTPGQRAGQQNSMLCGFTWNLTFYLNLLSASTIWCFCTDTTNDRSLGIPSYLWFLWPL